MLGEAQGLATFTAARASSHPREVDGHEVRHHQSHAARHAGQTAERSERHYYRTMR